MQSKAAGQEVRSRPENVFALFIAQRITFSIESHKNAMAVDVPSAVSSGCTQLDKARRGAIIVPQPTNGYAIPFYRRATRVVKATDNVTWLVGHGHQPVGYW
jgi:hypothetical protein